MALDPWGSPLLWEKGCVCWAAAETLPRVPADKLSLTLLSSTCSVLEDGHAQEVERWPLAWRSFLELGMAKPSYRGFAVDNPGRPAGFVLPSAACPALQAVMLRGATKGRVCAGASCLQNPHQASSGGLSSSWLKYFSQEQTFL